LSVAINPQGLAIYLNTLLELFYVILTQPMFTKKMPRLGRSSVCGGREYKITDQPGHQGKVMSSLRLSLAGSLSSGGRQSVGWVGLGRFRLPIFLPGLPVTDQG